MSSAEAQATIERLNFEEKLGVLEHLWVGMCEEYNQQAIPEKHLAILEERYAHFKAGKLKTKLWSEVKSKLINELHSRSS